MNTSFAIDWIRVTTKTHSAAQLVKRFCYGFQPDDWATYKPPNGYDCGLKNPLGHCVMWSASREDMGVNVMFDGRACSELHAQGVDMLQLVRDLATDEFMFTRLDLAIDIHGAEIDIIGLLDCEHTGSANNDPVLVQKGKKARGGATLYIGGRQSEKFMRIYDKAKERKLTDALWTRVELELKSDTATKIARKFVHMTEREVADMARAMMRGMYDPENQAFRDAMGVDPMRVGSTKNEANSTYDWIMASVAKTLAKLIVELPHRDVMRTFEVEVNKHIREIAARKLSQGTPDDLV